jgi:hypothetical protein
MAKLVSFTFPDIDPVITCQIADELLSPGPGGSRMVANNTYKSVRLLGEGYNLYYSVWCNNEHELYDLSVSRLMVDCIRGNRSH